MFFEDGTIKRVNVPKGSAVLIPQGTLHYVRNTYNGDSVFLQIFDHPKAGAVFVAAALAAMPRPVLNSAFTSEFPANSTGTIVPLKYNCAYHS
jgi:oxalate decarboxylase/phosphoglucose isomerase-like protein (cupin superfamily)